MLVFPREIRYYQKANGKIPYREWFSCLRNGTTQSIINTRLDRVSLGNFGDHKSVGKSIFELRFAIESGIRIYFGLDGKKIVILLCGGNKASQSKDIKIALEFWTDYKKRS